MNRRAFLAGSVGLGAALAVATACTAGRPQSAASGPVSATALTQVFGDGMKLTAVAVEYDREIDSAKVDTSSFAVANRTVTRVYASDTAAVASTGRHGRYAIIEMSVDDAGAALWGSPQGGGAGTPTPGGAPGGGPPAAGQAGPAPVVKAASAAVTQVGVVTAVDGTSLPAMTTAMTTSRVVNPIVDDFRQLRFADPVTGTTLDYNLFVPRDYDPARRYPLVLFMHDASVVGASLTGPLVQGLGAVSWASPEDQAHNPCFVVAPQYPTVVVDDDYRPTPLFDATVNLIRALTQQYSVDASRIYATGQSMGAMMTIGMNVAHPDLFAASYVVAGQWPTAQTGALARKRLWITVSQGDTKAYPGENEITALAERNGAAVARAAWNGRATPEEDTAQVAALTSHGASINYVALLEGTTLAAGAAPTGGASEHMGTWHVAYGIPGIREWIMQQRL